VAAQSLEVSIEVVAAGPVTAEDARQAYAGVLAERGLDSCCPSHPAGLSRAEALAVALVANAEIAARAV
jgi:hypothetical protein